ncbi:MAG: cell wall-binding repeat-containing protein [Lachnospiraceae bacterium]|nr:cell wall-binding repeat-containing protein [Candidatus Equihabitans merdae]
MSLRRKLTTALLTLSMAVGMLTVPVAAAGPSPTNPVMERINGEDRIDTALAAADYILAVRDEARFDNVVIANAWNFPDALSGSYLASQKNAPMLLIDDGSIGRVTSYLEEKLNKAGKVYILGGVAAVSQAAEQAIADKGFAVERISGNDRYQTNIEILRASGVKQSDLIVCSGTGFADALSASALGLPIMVVGSELTFDQVAYLEGGEFTMNKMYVIGGDGAVDAYVANQLARYSNNHGFVRVAGNTRFETSTEVAKQFFDPTSDNGVVMAYGWGFPDGLSGGPLAYTLNLPLVLTSNDDYKVAKAYANLSKGKTVGVIMGGTARISDDTAYKICDYSSRVNMLSGDKFKKLTVGGAAYKLLTSTWDNYNRLTVGEVQLSDYKRTTVGDRDIAQFVIKMKFDDQAANEDGYSWMDGFVNRYEYDQDYEFDIENYCGGEAVTYDGCTIIRDKVMNGWLQDTAYVELHYTINMPKDCDYLTFYVGPSFSDEEDLYVMKHLSEARYTVFTFDLYPMGSFS